MSLLNQNRVATTVEFILKSECRRSPPSHREFSQDGELDAEFDLPSLQLLDQRV